MKTLLITIVICTALYAGIDAIKDSVNSLNTHKQQLELVIVSMRGVK